MAKSESKDMIRDKMSTVELMNTIIDILMHISMQVDQPAENAAAVIDCGTLIDLCGLIKVTLPWAAQHEISQSIVSVFVQAVKDRAMWFDRRVKAQATNMSGGLQ